MSFLSGIRDKAVQVAAKNLILSKTNAVTDVKSLEIDSKQKTFSLQLELAGEVEPLTVTGSYRLGSGGEKTVVTPVDIKPSKEWLTILAAELVQGRTFEVPAIAAGFL